MNKLIPTIALIFSSILITSCGNTPTETVNETTNNTVETTQTESQQETATTTSNETIASQVDTRSKQKTTEVVNRNSSNNQANNPTQPVANNQPKVGTVKELVTGDIICYATIVDEQGKEHNVGASFEICAESEKYLNKKVRLSYEIASLNDCESIEPCGKSREESIISQMEILGESPTKPQASNSSTYSNGKWTVTIGNSNSWSGVNNTGNVTYKGCDDQGKCINLTGGKVSCRRGECITGWKNGEYTYILEQPITEEGTNYTSSSVLTVKKGANVILTAQGLKSI